MTRYLWYTNVAIAAGALLVLIIGLAILPSDTPLMALQRQAVDTDADSSTDAGENPKAGTTTGSSALVTAAVAFAKRLAPPPPPPKPKPAPKPKPKPKPKPTPPRKPTPPPKPKLPPKPKVPAPAFKVQSTFITGRYENDAWVTSQIFAWIMPPGQKEIKAFTIGDEVDKYTITNITAGAVELVREGTTFTIEVPKPDLTKPAPAQKKPAAKPPARTTRRKPTRRSRKPTPRR